MTSLNRFSSLYYTRIIFIIVKNKESRVKNTSENKIQSKARVLIYAKSRGFKRLLF